jgi:HAE1 family hydrophobic/amphiphilic exporter-1/multidrug efflux pump
VGRVELGSESYRGYTRLNTQPTSTICIYQLPGANASTCPQAARAHGRPRQEFSRGHGVQDPFDTTRFVRASIESVLHTLFEAVILVLVVVFSSCRTGGNPHSHDHGAGGAHRHVRLLPLRASPSTITLSPWCWPSASWWTTPSLWWRPSAQDRSRRLSPIRGHKKALSEVAGPIVAISLVLIERVSASAFMRAPPDGCTSSSR